MAEIKDLFVDAWKARVLGSTPQAQMEVEGVHLMLNGMRVSNAKEIRKLTKLYRKDLKKAKKRGESVKIQKALSEKIERCISGKKIK